jgi:hypothetical protein
MTSSDNEQTPVPLIRNWDYWLLLTAQGFSITGREIGVIVLPLLVLAITGSAAQVGLIAAAQALPFLVFSLPAGALIDRWNRRRVMLICEVARAAALLSLPVVWWIWELHLAHIYVVAIITGIAFVFYNIAEIAALPQLVAKEKLPKAMSATNVVEWAGELSGPAIGGVLVGFAKTTVSGAMTAYVVQGALQLLSMFSLSAIRKELAVPPPTADADLMGEMKAGAQWLWSTSAVRALAAQAAALNFLFGPVTIAIIVLATEEYAAVPEAIGFLFSVAGIVGLGAAIAAPWVRGKVKVGPLIVVCLAGWALGMVVMPLSTNFYVLALGWAIVTGVGGVYDVAATSYRLALVPDEMQGRVNSVFRFVAFGVRPVTLALGGLSIAALGARQTLWLLAMGMVLTALLTAFSSMRRLD